MTRGRRAQIAALAALIALIVVGQLTSGAAASWVVAALVGALVWLVSAPRERQADVEYEEADEDEEADEPAER